MPQYCVNMKTDKQGDHEVHRLDTCNRLPEPEHRLDLGWHSGCRSAVEQAKKTYPTANGCYYCSPECHTS